MTQACVLAFLALFFIVQTRQITSQLCIPQPWNYGDKGPDYWPHRYQQCKGSMQSPIDINEEQTVYDSSLKPFNIQNFHNIAKFSVANQFDQNNVIFTLTNDSIPMGIVGSDLHQEYKLVQFHFHWGENDYQGSEHYFNGEKFPLEIHFIYRSKAGNLTVLGFVFQLSSTNNTQLNELLDYVVKARDRVVRVNAYLALSSFLPPESLLIPYYRYMGSLTIPPCTESIKWNLFRVRIPISHQQLQVFRINIIQRNFRPVQNINRRPILSSVPPPERPTETQIPLYSRTTKSDAIKYY